MILSAVKQALAALRPVSLQETNPNEKGYALDVALQADQIVQAVSIMDQQGFFIETITGVDWLGEQAALLKEAAAKTAKDTKTKAAKTTEAAATQAPAQPAPPSRPEEMEVVYDFNHFSKFCRVTLRVRIPRDNPVIPTISAIYPAAHWHERETHDFFGIKFSGHPYLVPLLLPEDARFHPLRKDFSK